MDAAKSEVNGCREDISDKQYSQCFTRVSDTNCEEEDIEIQLLEPDHRKPLSKPGYNTSFKDWLDSLQEIFKGLADSEKTETLKGILKLCGPEQLQYLVQTFIPLTCFVDFLKFLPTDISFHILTFLDSNSALSCCLVSKHWSDLVNRCKELWIQLCWNDGLIVPETCTAWECKSQFLKIHHMLASLPGQQPHNVRYGCNVRHWESSIFDLAVHHGNHIVLSGKGKRSIIYSPLDLGWQRLSSKEYQTCTVRSLDCDDKYLYVASDRMAATYTLETGALYKEYYGHVRCLLCVSACSSYDLMVTGSADTTIKLWNIHTTEILYSSEHSYRDWVCQVKFLDVLSPDIVVFVSADVKQHVEIWAVIRTVGSRIIVQLLEVLVGFTKIQPAINECGFFCLGKQNDSSFTEDKISYYQVKTREECVTSPYLQHVRDFDIPQKYSVDELVGVGQRFAVVLAESHSGYAQVFVVLDLKRNSVLLEKWFSPNLAERKVCILEPDWLNGFCRINKPQCLFAVIENSFVSLYNNPFA